MGLPVPVPAVPPVLTKAYIHARTHFAKKRGFFSMGNANSRNQEKGVVFISNFGKLNSHSLITQGDDMTYIHK